MDEGTEKNVIFASICLGNGKRPSRANGWRAVNLPNGFFVYNPEALCSLFRHDADLGYEWVGALVFDIRVDPAQKLIDKVKITYLDVETQQSLVKLFPGNPEGYARFGEGGYLMHSFLKWNVNNLKTMQVRPDDIWVLSFPRSGTTWTQEMVWLLMNDFDYVTALRRSLVKRYYFLEFAVPDTGKNNSIERETSRLLTLKKIVEARSPRFIKSHLPLSLLPDNLLDTTKVVYVAREPRDVAVSFYHHNKLFKLYDYVGDFKTFWKLFVNDFVTCTPYFSHLKEAWAQRSHPNMLFIFYEELKQNMTASIKRIAKFLKKEITPEQIQRLSEHLDIKSLKNNTSVNLSMSYPRIYINPGAEGFVRNGTSGGWHKYFDKEMAAQAQQWLRAQLSGSDLRFPDVGSQRVDSGKI